MPSRILMRCISASRMIRFNSVLFDILIDSDDDLRKLPLSMPKNSPAQGIWTSPIWKRTAAEFGGAKSRCKMGPCNLIAAVAIPAGSYSISLTGQREEN